MEQEETLSESFKKELEAATANTVLDPAFKKKKLILWSIRTSITVILYLYFWKYAWVKWSLFFTLPLSLFSLASIIGSSYFLKRKMESTLKKIEAFENIKSDNKAEI
jgi:hypothetical protein